MKLRPYQNDFKNKIYSAWSQGYRDVLGVAPTGSGKTVIFSEIAKEHVGICWVIAHRQELVCQIAAALSRDGVYHQIIGPKEVIKTAVRIQMDELGRSFYKPNSKCIVAGVDTVIRRVKNLKSDMQKATLWIQDEAHHVLCKNKWGKVRALFPNARGLGVTASPIRLDGYGLGREYDGVFDTIVEGPTIAELIKLNYLSDYRIIAPPSNLDTSNVSITESGDFNLQQLSLAVKKSCIIGDVVKHYKKFALKKLAIVFVPSIEIAKDVKNRFINQNIFAEIVTSNTATYDRARILKDFRNRKLTVLINVDIFSEGFDLPAIEAVIMARSTKSYATYIQQFGRALRLMRGKNKAIIIDHVNNVIRHGLPDYGQSWTLSRREKRAKNESDAIPLRTCSNLECLQVYERYRSRCPYCGFKPIRESRDTPEEVDGDLLELSEDALNKLRYKTARENASIEDFRLDLIRRRVPHIGQLAQVKKHTVKLKAREDLYRVIAYWAGLQRHNGISDSESYKRFYFKFGVDVETAKTLDFKDTINLTERIVNDSR